MTIAGISNGVVIDHIRAGFGIKVLEYLGVKDKEGTVAFIMNAPSKKHGRKDIIKLDNIIDVDLAVLGLIDHSATVNFIKDQKIVKKANLSLPKSVTDVIICKNPRCVTSAENVPHVFDLVEGTQNYACKYCDDTVKAGVS